MHINSSAKCLYVYSSLLLNTVRMWENIGGIKFWQIAVDEANGEEYFDESNDRSSEVSLYLQVVVKIFWQIVQIH